MPIGLSCRKIATAFECESVNKLVRLIVTAGKDFFSEEKRDDGHKVEWLADGVPAFRLTNTCGEGRYRIEKQIVTDP